MSEYKQIKQTIEVPADSGVYGFLRALEKVLQLSRVTEFRGFVKNKVSCIEYQRWVRDEDDANANLQIDFESVTPIGVIRNNDIVDAGVADEHESPAVILCQLFHRAQKDHMHPTVLVLGPNSVFFEWFGGCGIELPKNTERVFNVPLVRDRFIDDDTLLLCASYGAGGRLIDTRLTYKLILPSREQPVRIENGADDAAIGSDGEGWADRRGEAVRAPEMGSAGAQPAGNVAGLPIPEVRLSGGTGPGARAGHGRPGSGRCP